MTCDIPPKKLIEYLYNDDLVPDEREHIQRHVTTCASCQNTLNELQTTSSMLQSWPDESPNLNMVFVEERDEFVPQIIKRHPYRWTIGIAATLAAMLMLAFLNFELAYQNGTLHASIGLRSNVPDQKTTTQTGSAEIEEVVYEVTPSDLKTPATQADLLIYQQATLALTEKLIRESEMRQRDDVNSAFIHLVRDLEQQRQQDIQDINHGLNAVYTKSLQNYQTIQTQWDQNNPVFFKTEVKDSIPVGFRPAMYEK